MNPRYTSAAFIFFTVFCLTVFLSLTYPLHQDPLYHFFADQRSFLGIPNFFNVVSNLGLILVGIAGVMALYKPSFHFPDRSERWIYILFFIFVGLSGLGSIYYHLEPYNMRLVWDRLPIALANVTLVSAVISDRISHRVGMSILPPLLLCALFSVLYWQETDDLRLYAFVLFFPLILIPLFLWVYPTRWTQSYLILEALGWVIIMRAFEYFDKPIYALTYHLISGHPLKHLSAAFAAYLILRYTWKRQPKKGSPRTGISV